MDVTKLIVWCAKVMEEESFVTKAMCATPWIASMMGVMQGMMVKNIEMHTQGELNT